jgi:DNA-binding MarR family transcriptional regulator
MKTIQRFTPDQGGGNNANRMEPQMVTTKKSVGRVLQLVETFRQLDPQMQAHQMAMFLHIAQGGGQMTVRELHELTGMAQAACSRTVGYWSKERWDKDENGRRKPGHDMLSEREDYADNRIIRIDLNAKGRRFLEQLSAVAGRDV